MAKAASKTASLEKAKSRKMKRQRSEIMKWRKGIGEKSAGNNWRKAKNKHRKRRKSASKISGRK